MNGLLRSWATPLSFAAFIAVGLTGILMFFGVRGGPVSAVHEWIGILFVMVLLLHLARNGRGVLAMLKTPTGKWFGAGLGAISAILIVGLAWNGSGFGRGEGGHGGHGPWRVVNVMASAPIEKMAPVMGLTPDQAVARLRQGNVPVDSAKESLVRIASDHGVPLPRMLNMLLPQEREPDID